MPPRPATVLAAEVSKSLAAKADVRKAIRQAVKALSQADMAKERDGTRCYVPRVEDKNSNMNFLHLESLQGLAPSPPFNIMEPSPTYDDGSSREAVLEMDAPLDLLVLPGLGFDASGGRLGRGGGYYDKFLARCLARGRRHGWEAPLLVALAFDTQVVDAVPMDATDEPVDVIVTGSRMLRCSDRGRRA